MRIKNTPIIVALGLVSLAPVARGEETSVAEGMRRNCIVVTPQGPKDGGDFGPLTPGTKTSGLQEAFLAAKRDAKDLYLSGGSWTESKTEPVVYFLRETLHIPWMQNFRCDSGHCVIHYEPKTGDAVVIDSQMSCSYRLGLIVSMSSGATVALRPTTAGPDRFKVITSTDFYFNALVGGGGAWPSGEAYNSTLDKKRQWVGTGLLLDGSEGPIDANRLYVTEVVGCANGIHLTGACTHNSIEATSVHLCQNHLLLGDPSVTPPRVRQNRITAHLEAQGIPGSTGVKLHGMQNLLTLSMEGMSETGDLLIGEHASENLIMSAQSLRVKNAAARPTNRIISAGGPSLSIVTPEVPKTGGILTNPHPIPVEIRIVQVGIVTKWSEITAEGNRYDVDGGFSQNQTFILNPGDSVQIDYTAPPQWRWKGLR